MHRAAGIGVILVAFAATSAPNPASARTMEDALSGKLALAPDSLPRTHSTSQSKEARKARRTYARAFAKHARGRAVFHQQPSTKSWKIHYAAVSPRPIQDATIKLIDVSHGRKLIGSHYQVLYRRGRIVQGNLTLSPDDVIDPNSRILMVVESNGRVIARRAFYIQGKPIRRQRRPKNRSIDFTGDTRGERGEILSFEAVRNRRR